MRRWRCFRRTMRISEKRTKSFETCIRRCPTCFSRMPVSRAWALTGGCTLGGARRKTDLQLRIQSLFGNNTPCSRLCGTSPHDILMDVSIRMNKQPTLVA
eukprot:Rmarinus@m.17770